MEQLKHLYTAGEIKIGKYVSWFYLCFCLNTHSLLRIVYSLTFTHGQQLYDSYRNEITWCRIFILWRITALLCLVHCMYSTTLGGCLKITDKKHTNAKNACRKLPSTLPIRASVLWVALGIPILNTSFSSYWAPDPPGRPQPLAPRLPLLHLLLAGAKERNGGNSRQRYRQS